MYEFRDLLNVENVGELCHAQLLYLSVPNKIKAHLIEALSCN